MAAVDPQLDFGGDSFGEELFDDTGFLDDELNAELDASLAEAFRRPSPEVLLGVGVAAALVVLVLV